MSLSAVSPKILCIAGAVVLAVSTACGALPKLTPSSDSTDLTLAQVDPTPAAADATPAPLKTNQALVKRDSIVESIAVDGLVAAQQEVPVVYQGSGKVQDVKVKAGQSVDQGDTLLVLDTVEISRSLDAAEARAQTSKANLAQARAQLLAQQQTAAQRAAAAAKQQQQAVADAESGLRKAQAQLATVMAGPSDADRHAAESVVTSAQANVQKAQAAQDKLNALPDSNTVRQTKANVDAAQLAVNKAKADMDALTRGPDPIAVSQAQRDIDRLNTQLQLAKLAKPDPKLDPAAATLAHDSAVADAQQAVQVAQDKLDKLNQPPAVIDVQSAQQRLQTAQDGLTVATNSWLALQDPPDQNALDAAQAGVDLAQQTLGDAQARLDALNARPSRTEVADAQDGVRRAQAALDAARTPQQSTSDPGGVDLGALQDAVNQADADVASLQNQLDNTKVVAPISGVVLRVGAKPGDAITSAKPVFVLTPPSAPIVRIQLTDDEATRLSPGQSANVVVDSGSSTTPAKPITATVAKLTTAAQTGGGVPTADLNVNWPSGQTAPKFGLPVQVNVDLQTHANVLVVPKNALRQNGQRTYVEVMDGTLKRVANVQVGVTTADTVEIVSGLTEGQVVLTS